MLAAMVGRRGGFWGAERLERYILDPFHWDFAYCSLPFLAAGLFYVPWVLIGASAGQCECMRGFVVGNMKLLDFLHLS